jgi:hypothetical protein
VLRSSDKSELKAKISWREPWCGHFAASLERKSETEDQTAAT